MEYKDSNYFNQEEKKSYHHRQSSKSSYADYDDQDFDTECKSPYIHDGFTYEQSNMLKIKIDSEVTEASKQSLWELLQVCLGNTDIEIKIKNYSDVMKAATSNAREKIQEDPNVDIGTEEEDNADNNSNDDNESLYSVRSGQPGQSSSTVSIKVEFEKISDLVIIQSWKELELRIRRFAFENQVMLKFIPKGYLLTGENGEALKKVEEMIQKEYNRILPIKVFENYPIDRINALYHSLRHIGKSLGQKLGLRFLYLLPSLQYATTYKIVAQKIPELKQKLSNKKEKNNIRFILYKDDIRNNKEIRSKFYEMLSENCKPHKEIIKEESSSQLTQYELKELKKVATQAKFYLTYEQQSVNQGNSKIKIMHSFDLISYYTTNEEKIKLAKELGKLKTKIKNVIKPSLFYVFDPPVNKFKYDLFVRAEIEKILKEKDVKISLVRDESKRNSKHFGQQQAKLALKIEGDKQNTKEIKDQIVLLMGKGSFHNFKPKYSNNQFANSIKQNVEKPQNIGFLKHFFEELHTQYPNIKIRPNFEKNKYHGGDSHHRGRGGSRGRGDRGRGRGGSHHNNEREDDSSSLKIQILFMDKTDLNSVILKLDEFFTSLVSKLYHGKLSELFSKTATNLQDFQSEYNVIIEEIPGSKTVLIGPTDNIEAAFSTIKALENNSKPVKEEIQIPNLILLNSFKVEYKRLVNSSIQCRPLKFGLSLYGDSVKVQETKNKIEEFLKNKEKELRKLELSNMPISHLKAIQEKRKFVSDLQYKNKIIINFVKPTSSKIKLNTGIEDPLTLKQLIVVQGDITKIQVDAIVSSTNLLFNDANIVQGVARAIKDKAGEDYTEECLNFGELKETRVFTSSNGNLTNCRNIINVCPPMYKSDQNLPQALIKLRLSVQNVLRASRNLETIALPLLASGNYGFPSNEAIIAVTEELASGLFKANTSLRKIYICEIDEEKIKFLEQQMKSMIGEKVSGFEAKNQWQFLDDGNVWKNYDLGANRYIDWEYSKGKTAFDVKMPAAREIGSHTIDLINQTLTRISTKTVTRIERKMDGWYENGEKLPLEVTEIIDLKRSQGLKTFDMFLNEYAINLSTMVQTNKSTGYQRRIQKVPIQINPFNQKFVIQNVRLIQESIKQQGNGFGKIVLEGLAQKSLEDAKEEIVKFILSQIAEVSLLISPQSGESHITYLQEEITKNKLECKGQIKPGQTIQLKGLKYVLSKIQRYFNTISQVQASEHILPSNWKNMADKDFELVLLGNDKEYQFVSQNFAKTIPNKNIKTIHRIQNAKFWRDFCQEKITLKKNRSKYNLMTDIKEEWLWHGTSNTDPSLIYAGLEECFDMQYANDGMWGRGLYFAVNASYSDGYATRKGTSRLFMLCRVLIGDHIELPSDRSLRKAPHRDDFPGLSYDSIKGNTGNSDIYILYRMRRAYPEYLIEYA